MQILEPIPLGYGGSTVLLFNSSHLVDIKYDKNNFLEIFSLSRITELK